MFGARPAARARAASSSITSWTLRLHRVRTDAAATRHVSKLLSTTENGQDGGGDVPERHRVPPRADLLRTAAQLVAEEARVAVNSYGLQWQTTGPRRLGFRFAYGINCRRRKVRYGPNGVCCDATGSQRGGELPLADLMQPAPLCQPVRLERIASARAGSVAMSSAAQTCWTRTGISGRRNGFGDPRPRRAKAPDSPLGPVPTREPPVTCGVPPAERTTT